MKLFDPQRHCQIVLFDWQPEKINATIIEIFDHAINEFDPKTFWKASENEDAIIPSNKSVYFGAAGNLWALDRIARFLNINLPFNKNELVQEIYQSYQNSPDTQEVVPSLFLGESGILLLAYWYNPSKVLADRLFKIIHENIQNPTLEILWGSPGTMIAASFMANWTNEERWKGLYQDCARFLIDSLKVETDKGEQIWTMDLYGKKRKIIGAGHGYFGNIFGLIHNLELLNEADQSYLLHHIASTSTELALEEGGLVNWLPILADEQERPPLVQWCHGSPGVINSLHRYPVGFSAKVEELLLKAGKLVWVAGPLNKGVALCHGTDGNGYAFLQLFKRTGDKKWLERAQYFASFACTQREGRNTLFTGDLGLAVYLISCLEQDDNFPFLETI